MALPFSEMASALHAMIEDSAADNFFDGNPMWQWLKENGQVMYSGGLHIQEPVVYDDIGAVGSFQKYDILDTTPNVVQNAAKAEMKRYYVQAVISRHEVLQSSGKAAKVALLDSKVENANATLNQTISTDLHSANGDSAIGLTGLRNLLSTTAVHHFIDPSDMTKWKASMDGAATALTLRKMDDRFELMVIGKDAPKMIVSTRAMLTKYKSLLVTNQRFGEAEKVSGGYRAVMFNDVPVFADPNVSGTGAGTDDTWMYFLNPRWLKLYIHKDDNFEVTEVPPLANQDVIIVRTTVSLAFVCNNRRMQGGFSILDPGE